MRNVNINIIVKISAAKLEAKDGMPLYAMVACR
jgi:hypothetical protein